MTQPQPFAISHRHNSQRIESGSVSFGLIFTCLFKATCKNCVCARFRLRKGPNRRRIGLSSGSELTASTAGREGWASPFCGARLPRFAGVPHDEARGKYSNVVKSRCPRMTEEEANTIRQELSRLRQEHRDLDIALDALVASGRGDHLTIQRLKKRKLAIKDRMSHLEDRLVPDIIA